MLINEWTTLNKTFSYTRQKWRHCSTINIWVVVVVAAVVVVVVIVVLSGLH